MRIPISFVSLEKFINKDIALYVLIFILSLTPLLGLGFKNTILSFSLVICYILYLNPKFSYPKTIQVKALLVFLLLLFVSMFFRQTPYGFHEFLNLGLGALFAANLINKNLKTRKLSKFLVYLCGGMAVFSMIYMYFSGADRAFGTFFGAEPFTTYPNAFADLLLVSIVLGSQQFLNEDIKSKKNKSIFITFLFLTLVGFWATFSRGAYLSLAIAMIFLIGLHFSKTIKNWRVSLRKYLMLLLISIFALTTATFISNASQYGSDFTDRFQTSDVSSMKSATERPILWQGALQIFKDNPLLGTGSQSFQFIYPKYQTQLLSNAPHPHNLILKLLAENGIFVASAFVFILILCLNPKNFVLKPEYIAAFIGLNIHFLLDYNLNFPIVSILFFLIISQLLSSEDSIIKSNSKALRLFGFTFTLVFIISLLTQSYGYYYIKQIENNPNPPSYFIDLAKIAPFEHQLYSQVNYPIFTDEYPNFHPYIYVQAQNTEDLNQKLSFAKKALGLNYYNDLSYHLLYIETLMSLNDNDALSQFEDQAYSLITDYIELLSVNTHNTITSKNPTHALNIIQSYENDGSKEWKSLETKLLSVYKIEKNKFQTRFDYNLPNLNE